MRTGGKLECIKLTDDDFDLAKAVNDIQNKILCDEVQLDNDGGGMPADEMMAVQLQFGDAMFLRSNSTDLLTSIAAEAEQLLEHHPSNFRPIR